MFVVPLSMVLHRGGLVALDVRHELGVGWEDQRGDLVDAAPDGRVKVGKIGCKWLTATSIWAR